MALSVIVKLAFSQPTIVGSKVTVIVHDACTASVAGQLFVCVKSADPDIEKPLITNGASPVLVNVEVWVTDVPII